jgi:hypothetical protein
LYGDRVQEAKDCVPLRAKSRLTRSRLTRFDCTLIVGRWGEGGRLIVAGGVRGGRWV